MDIKILNPVLSSVNKEDALHLSKILKYKTSVWREGPFRRTETQKDKPLVKNGVFLTGYIPRIEEFCNTSGIPLILSPPTPSPLPPSEAKSSLPITLESYQEEAIRYILLNQRGVIHHPTASGKTIVFLYFISLFPTLNTLIIVNTQDLLFQTFKRANEMFPGEVGIMGAGHMSPNRITISTIQTLKDLPNSEFHQNLHIVIVDEAHHISSFAPPFVRDKGGSYARVLSQIMAPIRLGFTATLPYTEEGKWALEGYLGPVIAKKKVQEVGRLAKIKIILRKLSVTETAKNAKRYPDVYQYAVVFNSRRNKAVLQDADKLVKLGRTVLILVTQIQHGNNILDMARRIFPQMKIQFVWGGVIGEERDQIKYLLDKGEIEVVIANVVWREGIDIPSLGSIINAAGGKSEIMTIQNLGRGLRTVPGIKEDVILVDYFDPSHKYLIDHFGQRVTLYFDEGWLGEDING